jgi:DNA-binding IclR family transcriptional regulator
MQRSGTASSPEVTHRSVALSEQVPTESGSRATYQIRALDRGLDILEAFSIQDPELTIGQLGERTGLPKPTIVRLLSVLIERGFVERVPAAERYRLGVRTLEVGSVFLQSTSVEAEARPIMRQLADDTGQTANLGILDGFDVIHIEVVAPDRPVRFWASIGKREAAHVSGLGKVLLAALNPSDLETCLRQPRTRLTEHTIVEAAALQRELQDVGRQGYAIDNEESNLGVVCIAAPIHDATGRTVAAVSISGLRTEFEPETTMQHLIALVTSAATQISHRLGWSG